MKYHRTLNERKMVVFVVQISRYFGPCRILPNLAVSCRILPYLPYPAVSCRILPYPAVSCVSCHILPYPAVSCRILPYPAVSCRILPYPAVSCRILPYPAVSCHILPYRIRVTGKPQSVLTQGPQPRPRKAGLTRNKYRHTPTTNSAIRTQTHAPRHPTRRGKIKAKPIPTRTNCRARRGMARRGRQPKPEHAQHRP